MIMIILDIIVIIVLFCLVKNFFKQNSYNKYNKHIDPGNLLHLQHSTTVILQYVIKLQYFPRKECSNICKSNKFCCLVGLASEKAIFDQLPGNFQKIFVRR